MPPDFHTYMAAATATITQKRKLKHRLITGNLLSGNNSPYLRPTAYEPSIRESQGLSPGASLRLTRICIYTFTAAPGVNNTRIAMRIAVIFAAITKAIL